jgi:hypothetical protein
VNLDYDLTLQEIREAAQYLIDTGSPNVGHHGWLHGRRS